MRAIGLIAGMVVFASVANAQNVKIQTKKNGMQVKVKETPAKANHTQVKAGDSKVQVINNPSGTKVMIKNHPPKGKKK
ncbi:MAG: hypothetical protein AB1304_00835 [Bacteroidota bacterium]